MLTAGGLAAAAGGSRLIAGAALHAASVLGSAVLGGANRRLSADAAREEVSQHILPVEHPPPVPIAEAWGHIHSTESFSAVDGPSVRMVVFTQGCAMRCMFCSNPDTWSAHGGESVSSKDIAASLRRLKPYLQPGGGGLTVSGGEPLLQPHFTSAICQEALALGLTTCIDTTGQGSKHHNWDPVLPYTDMVLFCIKTLDADKYQQLTGLQQTGALRFADELAARQIPFWARYVLVPGWTDSEQDLRQLSDWALQQPTLQGVELLPYHLLGRNKWEALGLQYPLDGVETPSQEEVRRAITQLEAAGLAVLSDAKPQPPQPA